MLLIFRKVSYFFFYLIFFTELLNLIFFLLIFSFSFILLTFFFYSFISSFNLLFLLNFYFFISFIQSFISFYFFTVLNYLSFYSLFFLFPPSGNLCIKKAKLKLGKERKYYEKRTCNKNSFFLLFLKEVNFDSLQQWLKCLQHTRGAQTK